MNIKFDLQLFANEVVTESQSNPYKQSRYDTSISRL
mgnify:CR=1 FL=1